MYTCAPLCQWWECLRGMCVFMCERMESMCKAHGCGKLGSLKNYSSFRWVLQAWEKVALLLAQGHTPATECSRHDRGQQHRGWEPEPFHARVHAFDVRTQVLSPEGLALPGPEGAGEKDVGWDFLHWAEHAQRPSAGTPSSSGSCPRSLP